MDAVVPNSPSSRPCRRLWVFSLTFSFVLFYFLIRETFAPKVITPGQQAFLLAYSLLIAGFSTLGLSRMFRNAKPPGWMDSLWKRFLAYFVTTLALIGCVTLLPLPKFYSNVLQHTVVFLVLPFFWLGGRGFRSARRLEGSPTPVAEESLLSQTDRDVVLPISRRKAVFLLIAAAIFVTIGWCMRFETPVVAWVCIAFFGLGIPLGLMMLLPGFSYLKIQREGFTMRHSWREYAFRWNEISDLSLVTSPQGDRVAFNVHKPGARHSALLREMYGRDMVLIDNYGLTASGLCALMQGRQAAAVRDSA